MIDLVTQMLGKYTILDNHMDNFLKIFDTTTTKSSNLSNRVFYIKHSMKEFISQISAKLGLPTPTTSLYCLSEQHRKRISRSIPPKTTII